MPAKVIGSDDREEKVIHNEWRDFSKTLAFKKFMEFAETNQQMLLDDASNLSITVNGTKVTISGEMANFLLQRRAGIDILKTYIRLYSE